MAKKISVEDATHSLELLQEALNDLETRLVEYGFASEEAGDWLFHIREILGDWREMQEKLAVMCSIDDLANVPPLLKTFNAEMIYSVAPHTRHHMEHLEAMLDKRFPENLDDDV
jgi:hypothetical protein